MQDNYKEYNEATGTAITGADKFADNGYDTTGAGKAKVDTVFNSSYGITAAADAAANTNAYGYVDYDFYLKATSDTASQQLRMTWCNMVYNEDGSGSDAVLGATNDAWRVAIFAKNITSDRVNGSLYSTDITTPTGTDAASASLKTILAPEGATYFQDGKCCE